MATRRTKAPTKTRAKVPAPTTVAQYLAAQPPAARRVLARVRKAIRAALPEADEVLSYGIPTVRIDGALALCFAGWKEHWALYPVSGLDDELLAALADRIVSKGTIRFAWSAPVPIALVARIARARAAHVAAAPPAKRTRARR